MRKVKKYESGVVSDPVTVRPDMTIAQIKVLGRSADDAKKRGLKSPDRADSLALTFAKPGPAVVKPPDPPASRVASYDIDNEMGL